MLNSLLSANMGLSQLEDFWHQPSSDIWQLFSSYNNLMLFAWVGFVSAIWTFIFDANESHLNMSERERDERAWQREKVCVLQCVCVVIFGQNIKNTAKQQDSWFCLHRISHKHTYTSSIHSQPLSAHIAQSHKHSKSFIHLLCRDAQNFDIPL